MITHVTDHQARAYARLMEQLKGVKGFVSFINVFVKQVQDLEDIFWQIFNGRMLNGVGAQLDQFGRLLDEPRQGFIDSDYLERLKAKIVVLRSSGSAPDLIRIFKLLLPVNDIHFTVMGRAAFVLDIGIINTDFAPIYQRFLHYAKSAGIDAQLIYSGALDSDTFTFDSGTTLSADLTSGNTSIPVESPFTLFVGDLVAIDPGTINNAELRVVTSATTGIITVDVATTHAHANGAAVAFLAHNGLYVQTLSATFGAATLLTFTVPHPFLVGNSVIIDPFGVHPEIRVITAITSTTISFAALAFSHASGTYVTEESHEGWGDEANPEIGGKLSGIIT